MIHIQMMKGSTKAAIFYKRKLNENSVYCERIKTCIIYLSAGKAGSFNVSYRVTQSSSVPDILAT